MPIKEEIFEFDPTSYLISKKLDEIINNSKTKMHKTPNPEDISFRDILLNNKTIYSSLESFEYPSKEIIAKLTPQGKKELFDYFYKQKEIILKEYCNNVVLSPEALKIGHQLYRQALNLKIELYDLCENVVHINEFNGFYKNFVFQKNYLIKQIKISKNITDAEMLALEQLYCKKCDKIFQNMFLPSYIEFITKKIHQQMDVFVSREKIPRIFNKAKLNVKLLLALQLKKICQHYIDNIKQNFANDKIFLNSLLQKFSETKLTIHKYYYVEPINEYQIEKIYSLKENFLSDLQKVKSKKEIIKVKNLYINQYKGPLDTYFKLFISMEYNKNIQNRTLFQKFKDYITTKNKS